MHSKQHLTLFYGVPSGCSLGSIIALEWLGEPYKLCRIEMPEVVSSPAYQRINPVGETPSLLTTDGRLIHESMAILNHLNNLALRSNQGFKQNSPDFDAFNQTLAYLNTSFFSAFSPLWYAYEHPLEPAAKQALTEFGATKVKQAHAELEARLVDRPWLLGSERSFADAYFYGIARWSDYHEVIDRKHYPHVQALFDKLSADPGVRFALAIENQRQDENHSTGGFLEAVTLEDVLVQLI